jgi:hypothetical protein
MPPERNLIRNVEFWGNGARVALRRRYVRELDRSVTVLAPAGYGSLTFRHADGWARGLVVLSENVQRCVRVPEPARWESGELCLTYDARRTTSQRSSSARWPIDLGSRPSPPRAGTTAGAGRTPPRRPALWADALRSRLS